MTELSKHDQIKRAFGIKTPDEKFRLAIVTRDDPDAEPYHPVTPFHMYVAATRWLELEESGFAPDAAIILLMRGARIEVLAKLVDETPDAFAGICRRAHARLTRDRREYLEDTAARNITLSNHMTGGNMRGTVAQRAQAGPGTLGNVR